MIYARTAFIVVLALASSSCKEGDTFVTNITSPEDWQGPALRWSAPPEAELRGTVGLDIFITDSSEIDKAVLFFDGIESDSLFVSPWRFEAVTDSLEDGIHVAEVRAWDAFGNLGISPILRLNIVNSVAQGPRLIWVPDDFARIQDAINASTDFDTIRVRDGVYYESINLFGKGVWLESEQGPIACKVDVRNGNNALYAPASREIATIRGIHFSNGFYTIYLADGSRIRFVNNFVTSDSSESLLLSSYGGGDIVNNLFSHSVRSVLQIGYHWGSLYNNVIQYGESFGLWNAGLSDNPIEYGYNLLWQNGSNYNDRFDPGIGDVYDEPQLNLEGGFLEIGSPAIDAGHPGILDLDSSRSDIGPFGGPWAY